MLDHFVPAGPYITYLLVCCADQSKNKMKKRGFERSHFEINLLPELKKMDLNIQFSYVPRFIQVQFTSQFFNDGFLCYLPMSHYDYLTT